jgi:site-specific DNA-methyltransferase (adenine-specific)
MTGIFHIVVARKPIEGTIVENCLQWGCGALWIDGTRIAHNDPNPTRRRYESSGLSEAQQRGEAGIGYAKVNYGKYAKENSQRSDAGRWPANLILGGEEVIKKFPMTTSGKPCGNRHIAGFATATEHGTELTGFGDSGSASRFFFNFTEQESDE